MRVIDILMPMAGKGGAEQVINQVAQRLISEGFRVRVVQMIYEGFDWVADGVEFYPILVNRKVGPLEEFVGLYVDFLNRYGSPSLIIATPWPFMSYVAKGAVSITAGNHTDICEDDGEAHSAGLPKVAAWLHGPIETYKKYGTGGLECLTFADCDFVLTQRAKKQILDAIPDADVVVTGNPIDMTGIVRNARWNRQSRRLMYVGRLTEEKRIDIIIEALSKTKSRWELTVTGDGEEAAHLKELAEVYGVEDFIEWRGWADNPWDTDCTEITALVVASDYEGFCMAAVEALARGIPVISTPVDGIIEYVKIGVNGYLFEKGSSSGLAEVLDAIDDGLLPDIEPQACADSVAVFEKERVLDNLTDKISHLLMPVSAHKGITYGEET